MRTLLLSVVLGLAACSSPSSPTKAPGTPGHPVEAAHPANRVLVLGKGNGPTISAMHLFPHGRDALLQVSESIASFKLFSLSNPGLASRTSPGSDSPNLEEVAALAPDLVLIKPQEAGELGGPLTRLGLKVLTVSFEDRDAFFRDIRTLGAALGESKRAEEISDFYQKRLERLKPPPSRPRTLFLYYSAKGGTVSFKTPASGWLQTHMVEEAGGDALSKTLPGSGWNVVSIEQIASWNPEDLFLVAYGSNPAEIKAQLLADPSWAGISAIQDKHLWVVPYDSEEPGVLGSWDTPGSRWILGQLWMARKLHPELLPDLDLRAEARTLYQEMHGLTPDQATDLVAHLGGDLD